MIWKRQGCSSQNLPRSYFVGVAWNFSHINRCKTTNQLKVTFLCQYPKRPAKSPAVDISRLNTPNRYQTRIFSPQKVQQHSCPFYGSVPPLVSSTAVFGMSCNALWGGGEALSDIPKRTAVEETTLCGLLVTLHASHTNFWPHYMSCINHLPRSGLCSHWLPEKDS